MKWQPELDEEEEKQMRYGYVSDNTAFMRWSTEIEQQDELVDKPFLHRHRHRVLSINKFTPLAFYKDEREIRLRKLRNINITLAKNAGLEETAEETALDNIDDAQTSRGWKGEYQRALITQRHEIREEKESKVGRFSGLFGKKPEEQQEVVQQ